MTVRVRFAPSPTGHVHIGNIRSAIFNWLHARHAGGAFLLRIEDTDRERSTPEAIETLLDVMAWLGLDCDEPPLYQSARGSEHLAAAQSLIEAGHAYHFAKGGEGEAILFRIPWRTDGFPNIVDVGPAAIDVHPEAPVEIDASGVAFAGVSKKGKPMPDAACLAGFRNLRVFDADGACLFELEPAIDGILAGDQRQCLRNAVRFEFTRRQVVFDDLIKGRLAKPLDSMRDVVVVRSDGSPVFHLANVCDDIAQDVTHIVRGDDHVENTYRHVLMFAALGAPPPAYAHLPMIVNQQGKPYSKRDGDAFVGDFRAKGFLPEALFNYLSLLGWNPGDEREKMTRDELVAAFSLDRVQQSAAQMDMRKLENLNGQYIAELAFDRFLGDVAAAIEKLPWGGEVAAADLADVARLMQTRTKTYADVAGWEYFFVDMPQYDEQAWRKFLGKEGVADALRQLRDALVECPFDAQAIEAAIHDATAGSGIPQGKLNQPLRVALTGCTTGAGVYETAVVLGRERVLARLDHVVAKNAK